MKQQQSSPIHSLPVVLLTAVCLVFSAATVSATSRDSYNASTADSNHSEQGKLYQQTLLAIKKGHKSNTRLGMERLHDHPLYPYLVEAELEKRLRKLPFKEVDQFLADHQGSVVAAKLHKKWLNTLAKKKRWPEFIRYYRADLAGNTLRCRYIEGMHQTGYSAIALEQTTAIWLSGKSLPDACDPVFKRWQDAGYKTDPLVWQRIKLALASNNHLLARYLSKRSSAALKPYARRLISVHRKPQRLANSSDFADGSNLSRDIIAHGLKRLAAPNPLLATELWVSYRGYIEFTEQQNHSIRNKIARQVIASGKQDALNWLITHDPNAEDSYLLEWRIRLALKQRQWLQASHWISILPDDLRQQPRWQYWLARAYQQTAKPMAEPLLEKLASQRNYYGFLAADLLDKNYGFNHESLPTAQPEKPMQSLPEIQRALAFFEIGEFSSARREWFNALQQFDQQQLVAATHLANQYGWHQQAIHTTIKAKQWNDLSIRFPLAYQNNMMDSAKATTIKLEWLYAIARQESAFAQDARSSAGARGLMQLLPQTARQVAGNIGIKFSSNDLYNANKNITLGSNYLKQLLDQFQGNRILATAAYNAGPHRVQRWLKNQPNTLPYDIWIETLPFYETRSYVQNVLAFSVIYGHRLGFNSPLIGQQESVIGLTPAPIKKPSKALHIEAASVETAI